MTRAAVTSEAWMDVEVSFLCNFGYGDVSSLQARSLRFEFDDICDVI